MNKVYVDIYLRGATKAAVDAALSAAGCLQSEGITIDEIGLIPNKSGWHVNLWSAEDISYEQRQALMSVLIDPPRTPFRSRA